MYSFETFLEGIKYTVYFFAGFTGIIQPFTPENPIEYEGVYKGFEKYDESQYIQAWYSDSSTGPRLGRIVKTFVLSQPMEATVAVSKVPGVYYHALAKVDGEVRIGRALTPRETLDHRHYFRYVIDSKGALERADHIYTVSNSHIYSYRRDGVYEKRDRAYEEGPTDKIPDL